MSLHEPCRIDWSELPRTLHELRDVVGPEAALKLAETYGGRTIYIPARPGGEHPISRLIGAEAAEKLAAMYGGVRLSIPKFDSVRKSLRNQEIIRERREGASVADLAARHGLTERWLYELFRVNILSRN